MYSNHKELIFNIKLWYVPNEKAKEMCVLWISCSCLHGLMSLMTFLQWNRGPIHWPEAFSVKRQKSIQEGKQQNVTHSQKSASVADSILCSVPDKCVQSHKSFIMWFLYQTFWRSWITGNVDSYRNNVIFNVLTLKE